MNSKLKTIRAGEWIFPAAAVFALLVMCIASATRVRFWFDELLSYYLLSDPSFSHMLGAQYDLINTTPPLYFILTWPLAQIFGAGELPLRVFSSIGIGAALVLTWHLLRRLFGNWPAAVAVTICFLSSHTIRYQNMEGRFYGLFLAEIAAAVSLAVFTSVGRPVRRRWLIAIAVVHAMLVTTHYFGFLYSGAILTAMFFSRRHESRQWIRCTAAVLTGWLAFIPCLPMFFHHLEFNKPHGWIERPTVGDLMELLTADLKSTLIAAAVVLGLAAVIRISSQRIPALPTGRAQPELAVARRTAAITMLMLVLVPIAVWTKSRFSAPLFVSRYFLSDVLVWSFVCAYCLHAVLSRGDMAAATTDNPRRAAALRRGPRTVLAVMAAMYVLLPTVKNIHQLRTGQVHKKMFFSDEMMLDLAKYHLPIVSEDVMSLLPRNFYSEGNTELLTIIDRPAAIDPEAGHGANTNNQIATALKRHYPDLPILTTRELLDGYTTFIVIDESWLRWFELRMEDHPEFECKLLNIAIPEPNPGQIEVYLVQKRDAESLSQSPRAWRRR
jgi:uncharacterized membrane protein